MADITKLCIRCGMEKNLFEFAKNISKKDGLQTYCKECHNAYCRDYAHNNKDKLQAYKQNNKDRINAYHKAYKQNNKDRINAYNKAYYENNKDRINAYKKAYIQGLKGHYLYIIYQGKRVAYVGSCSYLSTRISSHINCYSNIAKYMKNDDWTTIKTLDIGERVNSKEEREFIEYMLIEELEPMWNGNTKHKKLENDEREADLSMESTDILENLEYYFKNYKENDNKCNFVIDEGNIQEYADDISTFIDQYIEKLEDEYEWE